MKRKLFWIVLIIAVCVGFAINYINELKTVTVFSMDTIMTVKMSGSKKNLKWAESEIERLDKIFNVYDSESEIYRHNQSGSGKISKEMAEVLELSQKFSKDTYGCFDITLKNLKDLWTIKSANPKVPENEAVLQALEKTGMDNLEIEGEEVRLNNGIKLDLGGIAKGYATDVIVKGLKEKKVKKFILDLGGNIYGYSENKPLNIGIQNPYGQRGDVILTLEITDSAVVSSGGYERNFESDGKVYHHILDPKTGYPAETGITQVTVVGKNSALCDAYSTAIFVMGRENVEKLYEESGEFEYIIVENNNIFVSENLESKIKNVSEEFNLIIS